MGLVPYIGKLAILSDEAENWLTENLVEFSFKENEEILKEGQICNHLYFVKSGMLSGCYHKEENEICNWISIENDFATSFYSFISRTPSYETITSIEPSEVQAISHSKLNQLYVLFPETERAGRLILEDYYARLEERNIFIQFKPEKERYDLLLQEKAEVLERAPLAHIASYLGMNPETLSLMRAQQ